MGYNHAAAFIDAPPRDYVTPFMPWFGKSPMAELIDNPPLAESDPHSIHYKPKIDIVSNPINKGKTEAMLLNLREDWIRRFICHITQDNDNAPPREWAIKWLDDAGEFPKTADQLISGINNPSEIQRAALACLDAWHAL